MIQWPFNNLYRLHRSYQIYKTWQIKGGIIIEIFPDQVSSLIQKTTVLLPGTYIINSTLRKRACSGASVKQKITPDWEE